MSGPTELDETPAEEFSRLIIEFNEDERQNRNEAWNLIADFACEHSDAIIRALSQPQAGEPVAWRVTYADGEVVFLDSKPVGDSGVYGCVPLYASPQPANPAQVTNAIRSIVEDALNSAIPEPWEVAEHATQRILAALQSQPIAPAGEGLVTEAMVDACANILAQAAGCAAISQQRRNLARMALTAALSKQEPVGRPASVQAAFEVFAGKPDTGPHATALFRYIEQLEASAPKQGAK